MRYKTLRVPAIDVLGTFSYATTLFISGYVLAKGNHVHVVTCLPIVAPPGPRSQTEARSHALVAGTCLCTSTGRKTPLIPKDFFNVTVWVLSYRDNFSFPRLSNEQPS